MGDEINYFWDFRRGRKLTAATLLYVLNHYPPIVFELINVQSAFRLSNTVSVLPAYLASHCRLLMATQVYVAC